MADLLPAPRVTAARRVHSARLVQGGARREQEPELTKRPQTGPDPRKKGSTGEQRPRHRSYLPPADSPVSQMEPRSLLRRSLPPPPAPQPGRARLSPTNHHPPPATLARRRTRRQPILDHRRTRRRSGAPPPDWSRGNLGNKVSRRRRSRRPRDKSHQLARFLL